MKILPCKTNTYTVYIGWFCLTLTPTPRLHRTSCLLTLYCTHLSFSPSPHKKITQTTHVYKHYTLNERMYNSVYSYYLVLVYYYHGMHLLMLNHTFNQDSVLRRLLVIMMAKMVVMVRMRMIMESLNILISNNGLVLYGILHPSFR